jgi:hypothetical protein
MVGSSFYELERKRRAFDFIALTLEKSLDESMPSSMVRLGDGESQLMAPRFLLDPEEISYQYSLWFGAKWPSYWQLSYLRSRFLRAIRKATVLGIPELHALSVHKRNILTYSELMRRRLVSKQLIADAGIHWLLQCSGWLDRVFVKGEKIWLITCRDVKPLIISVYGNLCVEQIMIRGESSHPGVIKDPHWPNGFFNVLSNFRRIKRGDVVLVGAGALGKIYCDVAKDHGALALDIGSVFDGWAGVKSRQGIFVSNSDLFTLDYLKSCRQLSFRGRLRRLEEIVQTMRFPYRFISSSDRRYPVF